MTGPRQITVAGISSQPRIVIHLGSHQTSSCIATSDKLPSEELIAEDLRVASLPVNNQARSLKERLNEQQDCSDRSYNLFLAIVVQAFIVMLSAAFPVSHSI